MMRPIPSTTSHDAEGQAHDQEEGSLRALHPSSSLMLIEGMPPSETGYFVKTSAESADMNEHQDAPHANTDPHATPAQNTNVVMILEDTVELAEVIQATLENMGFKASYATHGRTGLEQIKATKPRLVLLDIGLPDISGWEILKELKGHFSTTNEPEPAIVIITAYGDPANRLIAKLQETHAYLIKPFTPDQIERVVRSALDGNPSPYQLS